MIGYSARNTETHYAGVINEFKKEGESYWVRVDTMWVMPVSEPGWEWFCPIRNGWRKFSANPYRDSIMVHCKWSEERKKDDKEE